MHQGAILCTAVGIFTWAALEPEEGRFTFDWLDRVLDRFAENGLYAWLATPSGARPAWMSARSPEVLRVGPNRVRNLHGHRHNHCYSSPVCREWLQAKYESLDALNCAWWTSFWAHTYTNWEQVESPAPHGEISVHGHNLDWLRYVTDRTVDFCRHEIAPLKAANLSRQT